MLKKYVLTGGPCSGKTETLLALTKKGYYHLNEVARYLIFNERKNPGKENFRPADDPIVFQKKVLETQLEWEKDVDSKITELFTDRAVIDGIAFLRLYGEKVFPELIRAAKESNYSKIFYLDMLSKYSTDEIRSETENAAKEIHGLIWDIYQEYGYKPIRVPEMSIEDRVKLISKEIRNNHSK